MMEYEFNLDKILKERRMSIRKAAALCGVSYSTAYAIAKNMQTQISLATLSRLASGLKIPIADLFREKKKE